MRKRLILAAFSIFIFGLSAGLASAQVPTAGNVFFGYTYYSTTLAPDRGALNGLQGTLEGKVLPFVGIVADITGQYGQLDLGAVCSIGCVSTNISTHVYEAMFGPRNWSADRKVSSLRRIRGRRCTCFRLDSNRHKPCHGDRRRRRLQDSPPTGMASPGRLCPHPLFRRGTEQ